MTNALVIRTINTAKRLDFFALSRREGIRTRKKPPEGGFLLEIPAATYSPAQSPKQYHRRRRA
jgi:hypothetical protein